MPSSFVRSRSTRRTATVTISAPDASMASIICAFDAYLPVPTMRRERNSRPAITNGCGSVTVAGEGKTARSLAISASAYEVDDFECVVLGKWKRREGGTITQNDGVVLDNDDAGIEPERGEKVRQRPTRWDPALRSIHGQSDFCINHFGSHHTCER